MDIQTKDGIFLRNIPDGTPEESIKARIASIRQGRGTSAPPEKFGDRLKREVFGTGQLDPTQGMSGIEKFAAGAGKAVYDIGRGVGQIGREILPESAANFMGLPTTEDIAESRRLDAPLMNTKAGFAGNIAGNIGTALPAAFIPGANTAVGASLIGAGMGALQPVEEGESRLRNTVTGGVTGVLGHGAGKAVGKGVSVARNKMQAIEQKVAAKAATDAASETATARSVAGNAAQNAYKQLEHLRELKAFRGLTGEEAMVANALEKELAEKATEKLIPAAALKQSTAQAYREAIATEAERAAKLTTERLSGKEAKAQAMARLKRYGPAAVGGLIGNMLLPGMGGAIGGAASGLVLRPAIHSMRRLAQNPAVQHKLLSQIADSDLLTDVTNPRVLSMLAPSVYAAQE